MAEVLKTVICRCSRLSTAQGFFDSVMVGPLFVPHQFIGVLESSLGGFGFDGALGYVYCDLRRLFASDDYELRLGSVFSDGECLVCFVHAKLS